MINREIGSRSNTAESLFLLARVEACQGDHVAARALYEEGLALAKEVGNKWNIAFYLEGLAQVVALQGEQLRAAQLWGAANALREAIHTPLPPIDRAVYERSVTEVRAQLGEKTFAAAWAEGRSMTQDQVLAAQILKVGSTSGGPSTAPSAKVPTLYPHGLTAREVEVLRLVAQGMTNEQVAEHLVISPRTVNSPLTSIFSKIQVSSRNAATYYAIEHHLMYLDMGKKKWKR